MPMISRVWSNTATQAAGVSANVTAGPHFNLSQVSATGGATGALTVGAGTYLCLYSLNVTAAGSGTASLIFNWVDRDNIARSHTSPIVSASATNFTSGMVVMDSSSAVSAITFALSGANLGGAGLITRYSVNYFLTDLWGV